MKNRPSLWHRHAYAAFTLLSLFGTGLGCDQITSPTPLEVVPQDRFPAWSPNGRSIAYYHHEKHENPANDDPAYPTGLYVLDIESGVRRMVAHGHAITPDWRPDGRRLAFTAGDLFSVRPDGSDLQQVTTHGSAFFPRYSPTGTTLSYGRSGTQEVVGLWVAYLANPTAILLTRLGFGAPPADWSPDGRQIVFEGPRGTAEGDNQIWTADSSGASRMQITANTFVNRDPAWSPDGQWIAWTAWNEQGSAAIWLMQADGSEPRELLGLAQEPSWAPDSERIVFSRGREGRDRLTLWTIRRDGSGLQQLTFDTHLPL